MRIKWKNAIRGYRKSEVQKLLSMLRTSFDQQKTSLEDVIEGLKRSPNHIAYAQQGNIEQVLMRPTMPSVNLSTLKVIWFGVDRSTVKLSVQQVTKYYEDTLVELYVKAMELRSQAAPEAPLNVRSQPAAPMAEEPAPRQEGASQMDGRYLQRAANGQEIEEKQSIALPVKNNVIVFRRQPGKSTKAQEPAQSLTDSAIEKPLVEETNPPNPSPMSNEDVGTIQEQHEVVEPALKQDPLESAIEEALRQIHQQTQVNRLTDQQEQQDIGVAVREKQDPVVHENPIVHENPVQENFAQAEPQINLAEALRANGQAQLQTQRVVHTYQPQVNRMPKRAVSGLDFWEDADDFLHEVVYESAAHYTAAAFEVVPAMETTDVTSAASGNVWVPTPSIEGQEQPEAEASHQLEQAATTIGRESFPASPQKAEAMSSLTAPLQSPTRTAVTDQILNLRKKYLLGKIAGEDLHDHEGRLIVGKHKPITEQVIERAGEEGKLAELIVHMIIPGLGD